jgi:hypothetical protein
MTPKTWFWFMLLIILVYWCLHRSAQVAVAHHVGHHANRLKRHWDSLWIVVPALPSSADVGSSSTITGDSGAPTYVPQLTMEAIRTPGGLLKNSEGLTDQHWCSTNHKGGCLKDVKGTSGTSPLRKEGLVGSSSIRGQTNEYNSPYTGYSATSDAYDNPDTDSQYTQWTHSSWNSKNGVPAFTVAGSSPFYGDPTSGEPTYWHPAPVPNPIWPGQDVSQMFPDNLELPGWGKIRSASSTRSKK